VDKLGHVKCVKFNTKFFTVYQPQIVWIPTHPAKSKLFEFLFNFSDFLFKLRYTLAFPRYILARLGCLWSLKYKSNYILCANRILAIYYLVNTNKILIISEPVKWLQVSSQKNVLVNKSIPDSKDQSNAWVYFDQFISTNNMFWYFYFLLRFFLT